jgi:hypothetical protein
MLKPTEDGRTRVGPPTIGAPSTPEAGEATAPLTGLPGVSLAFEESGEELATNVATLGFDLA